MKKTLIAILILLCIGAVLWATETSVLTSWVERRNQEPLIKPVWERVVTFTYDVDDALAKTHTLPINGILLKVIMELPLTTAAGTTEQLLILDNGDNTIFDSTEVAENNTHVFDVYEPLTGLVDLILEPSAASEDVDDATTKVVTLRGI